MCHKVNIYCSYHCSLLKSTTVKCFRVSFNMVRTTQLQKRWGEKWEKRFDKKNLNQLEELFKHWHFSCKAQENGWRFSFWGLARFCVHTAATWEKLLNITQKVWNYSDWLFLVYPWLMKSRSYKKKSSPEHHTSRITYHTSHVT